MFVFHIKAAWRNITHSKIFSILNIFGLAISLTVFILMGLYIEDELSFDKFNVRAKDIYRVVDDKQTSDAVLRSAQTAAPVAPTLLQEFPEIKYATRIIDAESLIRYDDKIFEERKIAYADADIFNIFSFEMLRGNAATALKDPATVVLTNSAAIKYFGKNDPIGKILSADGNNLTVTGVIKDMPANSHFQFDFFISMKTAAAKNSGYDWMFTNWYSNNFHTYILLQPGYNIDKLAMQMKSFDMRHREANGNTIHQYNFEKLTDIYLRSDRDNQIGKTGSLKNIYIFSTIALFILLIACINFINLSTARSILRAKEVAVKKVIGAAKSQMAIQFFTESFILCAASLMVALTFAYIILPYFNNFSGKAIDLQLNSPTHLLVLFTVLMIVSVLSGTYPALALSAYKPVVALKGKVSSSAWAILIRKGLVVFQFSVSVILIICTLVVYVQMNYLKSRDLGFKPDQTVVINFEGDNNVRQRLNNIKQEFAAIPGVEQATASSNVPGDGRAGKWSMDFVKRTGDTIHTEFALYTGDYDFLLHFKIPVIAGRDFSREYFDDSVGSIMINETAVKQLGFASAQEAIGVRVGMYPTDAKIIGVIKDFNFESLQKAVTPLAVRILPFRYRLLSVKINPANIQQSLNLIESKWKELVPERPIELSFLDESFNRQYTSEIKFGQVFNMFTILALAIACLGLFGLASFSMQQRIKEIGIRKVLGASVFTIAFTLSKEFLQLVWISFLIAFPLAYFLMDQWLMNFAYRSVLSFWIFGLAALLANLIALLTIGYQTISSAVSNPIKSLQHT